MHSVFTKMSTNTALFNTTAKYNSYSLSNYTLSPTEAVIIAFQLGRTISILCIIFGNNFSFIILSFSIRFIHCRSFNIRYNSTSFYNLLLFNSSKYYFINIKNFNTIRCIISFSKIYDKLVKSIFDY
jgi:hypothetical protein